MSACPACGSDLPEGAKFCLECGTRLAPDGAAISDTRKVVTVLFTDVVGSTALGEQLDAEAVRVVMARYFDAMKRVIERHGGIVEKFIGDAIMAVFGIPLLHEDDALRAVRAAVEMAETLRRLNAEFEAERGVRVTVRTGLNTGEVVTGDWSTAQTLVTGDAVNTAARLEQAAGPSEILIGEVTQRLVRHAVVTEPVPALNAKGKALAVPAFRFVSLVGASNAPARRLDAPLVGREAELERLVLTFRNAVRERRCDVSLLLSQAGMGKSRLTAEFANIIADDARVLRGRCLPYGEGVTYWPLRELVMDASGIIETDSSDAAHAKIRRVIGADDDAASIASSLASAIGVSTDAAPQHTIFWAVRKFLQSVARVSPLVVVWDDIHWAEPTLLDLIEYVAERCSPDPMLLLCTGRLELLEMRTKWGDHPWNAKTALLDALEPAVIDRLIDALPGGGAIDATTRRRMTDAADGNPLFVEEMLGMLIDDGYIVPTSGGWRAVRQLTTVRIPVSISALLAARIDQLPSGERAVAQRAAVIGRVFERAAVKELASEEVRAEVDKHLRTLIRKELVRPDDEVAGVANDSFRFRHQLIRDAAYDALPKTTRAELHERHGHWLERVMSERLPEFEEITGYHFEQAYRYRERLGRVGEAERELARRAAALLATAGQRALDRGDASGACALLQRAVGLDGVSGGSILDARQHLVLALRLLGRLAEAAEAADQLVRDSAATGDQGTRSC
ncbi:MAG: adenylate/guanylate cyclase domain-containing protein [Candidatus Limnocylindrales bacterium]